MAMLVLFSLVLVDIPLCLRKQEALIHGLRRNRSRSLTPALSSGALTSAAVKPELSLPGSLMWTCVGGMSVWSACSGLEC